MVFRAKNRGKYILLKTY